MVGSMSMKRPVTQLALECLLRLYIQAFRMTQSRHLALSHFNFIGVNNSVQEGLCADHATITFLSQSGITRPFLFHSGQFPGSKDKSGLVSVVKNER